MGGFVPVPVSLDHLRNASLIACQFCGAIYLCRRSTNIVSTHEEICQDRPKEGPKAPMAIVKAQQRQSLPS